MQAEKTDHLENFRVRFRAIKARRGLTLQQIADSLDVGVSTVGAWAQGKNLPEPAMQPKVAQVLGVSPQFLVHGIPVINEAFTEGVETPRQAEYIDSRKQGAAGPPDPIIGRPPMMVDPRFAPKGKPPTRAQVEDYLKEYLDLAEKVPGGIEHAFFEITDALSLETIRRRVAKAEQEL